MPSLPMVDLENNVNHSPHLVLLGAGASRACLPGGDVNGMDMPIMNDLIEILDLRRLLMEGGVNTEEKNFEVMYNQIIEMGNDKLAAKIEQKVHEYFSELKLPESPTLYDYLVLSLRDKDLIATFNWDPLLLQAYVRNNKIKRLPKLAFLHGNVMTGYCEEHKTGGCVDTVCRKCKKFFKPTRLLYPIKEKDYNTDIFIKHQWNLFNRYIKYAYIFTIFGYSAPKSDIEARNTMLKTWRSNPYLEQSEIEIIDIKSEEELMGQWEEFPHSHHYTIRNEMTSSFFMSHPRRSCEAFAGAMLQCTPWDANIFPEFDTIEEMHTWIQPLIDDENEYEERKKPFTYKATSFL